MRVRKLALGVALTIATAQLTWEPAQAAGFYLTEVGTPGSLGTAGVGNVTDTFGASSAWANPAAMTGITKPVGAAGLSVVLPKLEFNPDIAGAGGDDGGNAGETAAVPGAFYVHPVTDRLRLGLALTAPLGGGFDYGNEFAGRYAVTKLELVGVGASTSLGYKVNDQLSIGAGATLLYSSLDQDIALNQGRRLPDGKVKVDDADDFGVQGFFGLTWQITERASLGVVYRTEMDSDLKGDVKIENLLTAFNPSGTIKVSWTNPQWLDLGMRFKAREDLDLMLGGGWQDWSEFSKNQLAVTTSGGRATLSTLDRKFKDTWYLGGALQKRLGEKALLSVGVKYESSPVSDSNRTLDLPFDETWTFSANYGWQAGKADNFYYSLGASLIYGGDASVNQTAQRVQVAGDFDSNWFLFLGGNLRYRF
jgi:long-chain fatty acid transport protein